MERSPVAERSLVAERSRAEATMKYALYDNYYIAFLFFGHECSRMDTNFYHPIVGEKLNPAPLKIF
jgi:hypothetical protein